VVVHVIKLCNDQPCTGFVADSALGWAVDLEGSLVYSRGRCSGMSAFALLACVHGIRETFYKLQFTVNIVETCTPVRNTGMLQVTKQLICSGIGNELLTVLCYLFSHL